MLLRNRCYENVRIKGIKNGNFIVFFNPNSRVVMYTGLHVNSAQYLLSFQALFTPQQWQVASYSATAKQV